MTPDLLNGLLELGGAFAISLSVRRLHIDKAVAGVSWGHVAFFAFWGYWNLYFYPSLDQMWSFWGGVAVVSVNTIWLIQMIYYTQMAKIDFKLHDYDVKNTD